MVPADKVVPGTEVTWTVTASNICQKPAENVTFDNPVPPHMSYVANSATGPGADISFSLDGSRLFLAVAPTPEPEKDEAEEVAAEEKVVVDLWHWKDDYIQPMQKVRAEQDRNRSYRAVFHLKEKKYLQLADETMDSVNPASDGRWALGNDDRQYRVLVGYDTNYSDYFLVNTSDRWRADMAFAVAISCDGTRRSETIPIACASVKSCGSAPRSPRENDRRSPTPFAAATRWAASPSNTVSPLASSSATSKASSRTPTRCARANA